MKFKRAMYMAYTSRLSWHERLRSNRFHWPCAACRANLAKSDDRHSREPEGCKWPLDEPESWTCPACIQHLPRAHATHSFDNGSCKWATAGHRSTARRGHHPRDPRVPASYEPTQLLRPEPDVEDIQPHPTASASTDPAPGSTALVPDTGPDADRPYAMPAPPKPRSDTGVARTADASIQLGRPARGRDASSQIDDKSTDWSA